MNSTFSYFGVNCLKRRCPKSFGQRCVSNTVNKFVKWRTSRRRDRYNSEGTVRGGSQWIRSWISFRALITARDLHQYCSIGLSEWPRYSGIRESEENNLETLPYRILWKIFFYVNLFCRILVHRIFLYRMSIYILFLGRKILLRKI